MGLPQPLISGLELLERLITERGSAQVIAEHLAFVKSQCAALEAENRHLRDQQRIAEAHAEQNRIRIHELQAALDALRSKFAKYACDHCGSPDLRRIGNQPNPTFGAVGMKDARFNCDACGRDSLFLVD